MRPLVHVDAADAAALTRALAAALDGGAAVRPVPAGGARGTGPAAGAAEPAVVPDGTALVIETSGSTDAPKRVLLSAAALRASADATSARLGGRGRWLLALPGHYIAGAQVLVRSLVAGTDPVVLDGGSFDAGRFAAASARLGDDRPRYTSLVPVQLARLVDAAEADPSGAVAAALAGFAAILVGGQRLEPALAERAAALGARVVRTYGSSETAGGCVYDGVPLDGVRLDLADGEVRVAGPVLADGYLDDPERTARAFVVEHGDRWYRTGDLGAIGNDGRLRVTGRADDVVVSGGVKVALGEVERAVRAVDGFGEAVVVAVPDAAWGERPAVAVARSERLGDAAVAVSVDDGSARERLRAATDAAGLPPAARPVRVAVLETLPLLASGKPDRRAIRRLLAQ